MSDATFDKMKFMEKRYKGAWINDDIADQVESSEDNNKKEDL